MRTPGAVEETYGWLRFGRQDLARHGDGLAVEAPPFAKALGFLDRDDFLDPNSTASKQAAADWQKFGSGVDAAGQPKKAARQADETGDDHRQRRRRHARRLERLGDQHRHELQQRPA